MALLTPFKIPHARSSYPLLSMPESPGVSICMHPTSPITAIRSSKYLHFNSADMYNPSSLLSLSLKLNNRISLPLPPEFQLALCTSQLHRHHHFCTRDATPRTASMARATGQKEGTTEGMGETHICHERPVSDKRRDGDHVREREERCALRPAEVLVPVYNHVCSG